MYEEQRADDPESQTPGEEGGSVPLNWACTICGYRVEEMLPDCGASKEDFDEVPVPGF
ncbi:MAG: hypothetical protein H0V53_12145 [Rubrobacter sp.]|nr:hypothetical protein [Rubrobacter sp.]